MSRILGFWSGHDCSFCVLNDGIVEMHVELERFARQKEIPGDSIDLFYQHHGDVSGVIGLATCHMDTGIKAHAQSWQRISSVAPLHVCGHHQAHAAHGFYSSNFEDATIITIDGGGIEDESGFTTGVTFWSGVGTKISPMQYVPLSQVNIGGVWSRTTRHIFGYESGAPFGNQSGSTMALAALAKDPDKHVADFRNFMTRDLQRATARAPGHVTGMSVKDPRNPKHPFLDRWKQLADADSQAKYDMAGALQQVTTEMLVQLVRAGLAMNPGSRRVCLSGGVALNSVATGKLLTEFPGIELYVPPVPYDAGLTIGAVQHAWHHTMGNPRVRWIDNATPYLGRSYSKVDVEDALRPFVVTRELAQSHSSDEAVLDLIAAGKVISVYAGRAESGRRALGNRSILADPRRADAKDRINAQIKSRQWFRPFAPSILRERVSEWFERDVDSPYMGFVVPFREEKRALVPAVVHFDGTGRLQTVTQADNPWYHGLLTKWEQKTGMPILLNTSFNSTEPIVETPAHAVDCFRRTKLDGLYFADHGILVQRA